MVDRAKKISELTAANSAANTDYLLIVTNTAGTPVTQRINYSNVIAGAILASVSRPSGEVIYGTGSGFTSSNTFVLNSNGVTISTNSQFARVKLTAGVTSNIGPDTPNNYFLGNTSHPWGGIWTSTIRTANISYGDTDIIIQVGGNTASYLQSIMQNTSNAANASTNYNVSADTANATSNYGEFGINSSTHPGTNRFSDPTAVYVAAATSNLALGTYGNYPVNIVVNSNTNWTFGTSGQITFPDATIQSTAYPGVLSWTITASGTSDYVFSGPGIESGNTNDPVLYLYRGFTYKFINNATGHPFAIRVSNGGADYTLGITGSQTGTQTFTVPMNAPSTLYYQCTVHSVMGNVINIL